MNIENVLQKIQNNEYLDTFKKLYGQDSEVLKMQKERYIEAVKSFTEIYPKRDDIKIFSASGRTEIGGNHTDHQHGCVFAAAVNLDAVGVASFHNDGVIRIKSKGYDAFEVCLDDLSVQEGEKGSPAIVRGMLAKFDEIGVKVGGMDIYTTSDVLGGSGISSSAAFEILIGTIIDNHYNGGKVGAVEIAKFGQFAENVYFGKNSGLMDQMVSSVGGLVAIDFRDTKKPQIKSFDYDFEQNGYFLCITDTKGSHANLSPDYDAIRSDMESVAAQFGKEYLREVDENEFYEKLPELRKTCSDRALVRASHFFNDNSRAQKEPEALQKGDLQEFLRLVNESGDSSAQMLQNLYSLSQPTKQEIVLAIMVSKKILDGKGAVRVHGGGFAGTIQAFVPKELADTYINEMDRIFGKNSCLKLRIRSIGGTQITE